MSEEYGDLGTCPVAHSHESSNLPFQDPNITTSDRGQQTQGRTFRRENESIKTDPHKTRKQKKEREKKGEKERKKEELERRGSVRASEKWYKIMVKDIYIYMYSTPLIRGPRVRRWTENLSNEWRRPGDFHSPEKSSLWTSLAP